jgi:hypothetical protein
MKFGRIAFVLKNTAFLVLCIVLVINKKVRACSLVGRAPRLQRGGHGFESRRVHHKGTLKTEQNLLNF